MVGIYTSQFLPGAPKVELADGWVTITLGTVNASVHLKADEAAAMAREILALAEQATQQAAA